MLFVVHTKLSVNRERRSPHFVILRDKVDTSAIYMQFICTCGSSIRCGIPCLHLWAVFEPRPEAAFHLGLVNDLWLRRAHVMRPNVVLHNVGGEVGGETRQVERAVIPAAIMVKDCNANDGLAPETDMRQAIAVVNDPRMYADMLGLAKRAI